MTQCTAILCNAGDGIAFSTSPLVGTEIQFIMAKIIKSKPKVHFPARDRQ